MLLHVLTLGFLTAVFARAKSQPSLLGNLDHSLRFADPSQRYLPPFWWADTADSHGHFTVETRLPTILQDTQKDFQQFLQTAKNTTALDELRRCNETVRNGLAQLMEELRNNVNAPLTEFPTEPHNADSAGEWNWAMQRPLAKNQRNASDVPRWYDSPTTFVECYFYRRLRNIFQNASCTKSWDHFEARKAASLEYNMHNIEALLDYLANTLETVAAGEDKNSPLVKEHLINLMRLSVWGNKGDLAHTATHNKSASIISHNFHDEQLRIKEHLLVDQSEDIWTYLTNINRSAHINIICDNYGFELTTDLILGEFLIVSGLASTVHYRVKTYPWYVSDVTIPDFHRTLNMVDELGTSTVKFGTKWKKYLQEGKFVLTAEPFWTLPYDYDVMDIKAPELYAELQKADLLIFKGDLNYRKLTGELRWSTTETFSQALRAFRPTALCSLRGIKSTIVVGITDTDRLQRLHANESDWMLTGKYSVIQFENKQLF